MAVEDQEVTKDYAIYCGDTLEVSPAIPDDSIHLSITSPPFAGLYLYSSNPADLSNARDYREFFEHYGFVVDETYRMTVPGRMSVVHCMDVPSGNTGRDHLVDFPGDIIRLYTRCRSAKCSAPEIERQQGKCGHGWFHYAGRRAVWKEPLAVRNRTLMKNLAHKTIVDDSSKCSVASADYILEFRKRGDNPVPVAHPSGLMEYFGSREIPRELLGFRGWTGKQTENRFSHWIWRQYASAFWDDVRIDEVLPFKPARDQEDEKHVHPLQLDVIKREIILQSNPGENVWDPFLGVGSTAFAAVQLGRRGLGSELKPSYFRQAKKNMAAVNAPEDEQPDLGFEVPEARPEDGIE
jgi:hypothetical protein